MKSAKFLLELLFLVLVCLPVFCLAYILIEISFLFYNLKKTLKWKITIYQRSRHK
jgi:hypothetical protein